MSIPSYYNGVRVNDQNDFNRELINVRSGRYKKEEDGSENNTNVVPRKSQYLQLQMKDNIFGSELKDFLSGIDHLDSFMLYHDRLNPEFHRGGGGPPMIPAAAIQQRSRVIGDDFSQFTNALSKCQTLQEVYWYYCSNSIEEVAAFAEALVSLPNLKELALTCAPHASGIAAITTVLQGPNNSIQKLNVTDLSALPDKDDADGMHQLEQFFQACQNSTHLEEIQFQARLDKYQYNGIGSFLGPHHTSLALQYLCGPKSTLKTLELKLNPEVVDLKVFCSDCLKNNNSLQNLVLRHETNSFPCPTWEASLEAFHEVLESTNYTLKNLKLFVGRLTNYCHVIDLDTSHTYRSWEKVSGEDSWKYVRENYSDEKSIPIQILIVKIRFLLKLNADGRSNIIKVWDKDNISFLLWLWEVATKDVPVIYYYLRRDPESIFNNPFTLRCCTGQQQHEQQQEKGRPTKRSGDSDDSGTSTSTGSSSSSCSSLLTNKRQRKSDATINTGAAATQLLATLALEQDIVRLFCKPTKELSC